MLNKIDPRQEKAIRRLQAIVRGRATRNKLKNDPEGKTK
jgi:hypothetical protein